MRVTLHVVAGPQTGRDFTFDQHDTFMIGRSEDAQFCLPHDRFFSRHHCILEIAPPQAFLRDLGSTNGTFVNGMRVETAYLKNGDRIQGGETILEVEVSTGLEEFDSTEKNLGSTNPSIVPVTCLNCGIPATVEAESPEARFSYVCDDCREKLKANPQPIPNYQMIRVIGQGGMGSVMLGRSRQDGRAVAIKTLLPEVAVSEQSLKRFIREIEVASALQHPISSAISSTARTTALSIWLPNLSSAWMPRGSQNIAAASSTTARSLRSSSRRSRLSISLIRSGFVHRDIKEQNILIHGEFPNSTAKLTDFGLSKSFKETGMSGVTMVGDVAGTIAYMPPEQVRDFKDVKPPSDIYAVGMMAYSLLTGAHALDISPKAGIAETVKAIFEKPIIPIRDRVANVPPNVAAVIETALAKQVENRWRTAGAMREALLSAAAGSN